MYSIAKKSGFVWAILASLFIAPLSTKAFDTHATIEVSECTSYDFFGNTLDVSGSYSHVVPNAAGCDSTITLNLEIGQVEVNLETIMLCQGECAFFGPYEICIPGFFQNNSYTTAGCDSITTLELIFLDETNYSETVSSCEPLEWNGQVIYENGYYIDTLISYYGCDSIIALEFDFDPIDTELYFLGGGLYTYQENATFQWLDCNNNMTPLPGENANLLTGHNGDFALEITSNFGCVETTDCYTLMNVDAPTIPQKQLVDFSGEGGNNLISTTNRGQIESFQILDLNGYIIYQGGDKQWKNKTNKYIPAGIYLKRSMNESSHYVEKIFVW